MAYPVTLNGTTYTLADFEGTNYVDGLPNAFEDFVTHAGNTYQTTSTTSIALGTGTLVFTVADSGKPYSSGTPLRISNQADETDYIDALVTTYSGTTLTVNAVGYSGTGTIAAWNINIGGGPITVAGTLPISQGGTGATTAAAAATALGLGTGDTPTFAGLNVTGTANFGDVNITNVGDIALDTISSDAGTSVTVSLGSDAGDDFIVGSNYLVVEGDTGNVLVGTTTGGGTIGTYNGFGALSGGTIFSSATSNRSVFARRSTDGSIIDFRKDGSTVGSIGVNTSRLTIGSGDTGLLIAGDLDNITPYNTSTNASRDNAVDLGNSSVRFKDLYLSGGVVFGATGGNVTSKTLDDYEEGTWTAAFTGSATTGTGYYTKVGNTVFITVYGNSLNVTSSPTAVISGLPFTNSGGYSVASISHDTYSNNSYNGYFGSGTTTIIPIQDGTIFASAAVVGNPRYIMVSGTYITNS